jgi:sugar phosphate isomerase/epimerase
MTSRRSFLKQSTLISAAAVFDKSSWFMQKKDIGIQLYTVRDEVGKDLANAIAKIAESGYTQVEMFGYSNRKFFGKSIQEIADLLKKHNLTSPSGHYMLADMMYNDTYNWESWKYLIDDAKILGHKYLVIPYMDDKHRSLDNFKRLAERLNKGGEMAKSAGMFAGYHNHEFEFKVENGQTGWETLLKGTDPSLVKMEMDIYWVRYADSNPMDWFKKYPGRFPLWHVKDMAVTPKKVSTIVGTGVIDFKELYAQRKLAGLEYLFVEQEQYTKPVFECIKESYDYLSKNVVK